MYRSSTAVPVLIDTWYALIGTFGSMLGCIAVGIFEWKGKNKIRVALT